jgi:hypothetical protein
MLAAFKAYFDQIKKLEVQDATEHTLRPAKARRISNSRPTNASLDLYHAPVQRLFINPQQYFTPVPAEVWNFHIGGYQVLDKYLKSRQGRQLSLDEIENVINVVKVLRFTIDRMQEIDEIWQP